MGRALFIFKKKSKERIGIRARLKGDGNSCPVAERRTAWGMAVRAKTTATYSTKARSARRNPSRSRYPLNDKCSKSLRHRHPPAIANRSRSTSHGVESNVDMEPRSHLMPTSESKERTPPVNVAESSHDKSTSSTSATPNAKIIL